MTSCFRHALVTLCALVLVACAEKKKSTGVTPCSTCRVFSTTLRYTGNLGGISGADEKCNSDSQSGTATFKALLSGRGGDSVIRNNTIYVTISNQTLTTSDGNARFTFPLANAIGGDQAWTGLDTSWATVINCTGWTSGESNVSGALGNIDATTTAFLYEATPSCDSTLRLICVEQ
jgi:hypothetical protein